MGLTLAEKIIARAAGCESVTPGEIVTCQVDLAMIHDSGGPRRVAPLLERLGVGPWDADKVVVVSDHYVPAVDAESAAILDLTRRWVAANGIRHFYDMRGICHVVLPEHGHLRPGLFVVGGDSHSPTGGAFGAFMFGVGATDMAGVLATGETWIRVPESLRIDWQGELGPGLTAKDMALAQCARLGLDGAGYGAIEYGGSALAALDMAERMTLCNMAAELGAQTALVAPDATTAEFLRLAGADAGSFEDWQSDPDASFAQRHEFDAGALAPQIALPDSPANAVAVEAVDAVAIDQAYIGACTGAKLLDLQRAAAVLRGRQVAPGVRLLLAPASTATTAAAAADGTLATLTAAGAILMPSGCGACAGYGAGVLAAGEVCIASTARNFKGRMGAADSRVYLASPFSVAAAAVAGRIVDPRELLEERA
ncbi:MAG: aconitase/3-isopropylmalate dehydratase large subunit family protein [Alphaproteobacteria bacterium]|nr:3-isopropylmalate dehydratase [Rhodospirillaceae bacterium]MDP6407311.1 aconitase/3-isopropylmalate dehydratase large subunit family protein [Alphaproteobacteria bacterium]MDP6621029.1 aconitase/3-isopropylmalate dehydratase large subunit family protein [Alphaproteobacteria bacterium]